MASLPALARALLSEDLGGRDEVPRHVADRVSTEARRWAEHGFGAEDVRPWLDLPPDAAAYLAERGVSPRVLDLPVSLAPAPMALKLAITSGRLPVERAYELLVATGEHRPAMAPASGAPFGDAARTVPNANAISAAPGTGGTRGAPTRDATGGVPAAPAWSGEPDRERQPGERRRTPVAPVIFSHGTPEG
ncbi:hypothetical protein ACFFWC_15315 [Plantactinospora siamensis]|uniref:Uncharacterized protein n=1 Tax=Plantactinospora siamensis TaxID=555372 RepID=A0ABV6P0L9_9ACTN